MTLVIATTNRDKLREIRALLANVPVQLQTLSDHQAIPEPDETGTTFEDNARLKALAYAIGLGEVLQEEDLVVAEDSGLVVDAIDGAPGVQSARFLGADASYPARFAEIARRLAERPGAPRTARFVCALVAADRHGQVRFETRGEIEGRIAPAPAGSGGFGYDPIFLYPPYGRTLAEVSDDEKRAVAHRGQAFRAFARWLNEQRTPAPQFRTEGPKTEDRRPKT
jgi:XTP/dITP diphosphohydrolase